MNEEAGRRITPYLQQYLDAKRQAGDAILFFRMGDFYEMFFEDALTASKALEITLTSRDKRAEAPIPMCGVPAHAVNGYLSRLLEQGFKVAICDQLEDPATAKGIVRRDITRIITPGVILDSDNLAGDRNNYLAAVLFSLEGIALASIDVTCGDFRATLVEEPSLFRCELARLEPAEIICPESARESLQRHLGSLEKTTVSVVPEALFSPEARELENAILGTEAGTGASPTLLCAARALLRYVSETQRGKVPNISVLRQYRIKDFMVLDETASSDLELNRTIVGGRRRGSLLAVLDRACTSMGKRLLKQWLNYPLLRVEEIVRRQDAIEELLSNGELRHRLIEALDGCGDLERLLTRIQAGNANPRDVLALGTGLTRLRLARERLPLLRSELLQSLAGMMDPHEELAARILNSLVDEPPATVKDGGIFRQGVDPRLDEYRALASGGRDWMAAYEASLKAGTGISSLKVRFNNVFGYFIEVTRTNLHMVPQSFIRKQTTANAERFYTPELKEYEEKVLHADDLQNRLEYELFGELRDQVLAHGKTIALAASAVAVLDVLLSLATVAEEHGYSRPELDYSGTIDIQQGRHPVVELLLPKGRFVPNDIRLDVDSSQILLITGPNMAGKSTVMRQTALIVVLAQIGSFVPAKRARIGVVDRVFTRVGATDSISRGLSTFMMEMTETSEILRKASRRSLVVLDEIGRGTSTYDGLAIAWAVTEYLHDVLGARTLFATHYHELTELVTEKPRVKNFSIAVREFNDEILFLHQLVEGATSRSYGVQVARLAGVPMAVIERAKELLRNLEEGKTVAVRGKKRRAAGANGGLFPEQPREAPAAPPSEVLRMLVAASPDELSPRQALELLYRLRLLAQKELENA